MAVLDGYDETDKGRIKALAAKIVEGMLEKGEIPFTDEAIRAAMPEAVTTAKATVNALNEFLCG